MNPRRTPGPGTIAAWGGLALMGYLLAFGPACWLDERAESPIVSRAVSIAYRPLIWSANRCSPVATAILWYAGLGARPGVEPSIGDDQTIWWGTILGGVVPYHTTISCTFGDDVADAVPETAPDPERGDAPADDAAL